MARASLFLGLTQQAIFDEDQHSPTVDIEAIDTERRKVVTNLHQGQVDEESYHPHNN